MERRQQLASEALESERKWNNLATYHRSRGETREATYAEQAAANARRYADIMQEPIDEQPRERPSR